MKAATYATQYAARTTGGAIVTMPDGFDLEEDYRNPRSYLALRSDGRRTRVRVDHDATGTATTGTGDTVVRCV